MKKHELQKNLKCPRCQTSWSTFEAEKRECDKCGWPEDEEDEQPDDDYFDIDQLDDWTGL